MRKAGFTTYVPQRDGIKLDHQSDVRKIFEEDKKAVTRADLTVANLDGIVTQGTDNCSTLIVDENPSHSERVL